MSLSIKTFREKISGITPRDLIYPGIILVFFIIVMIIFFLSTRFLTKNINNAFLGDTGTDTNTLNMDNYTIVAKKLGVTVETQRNKENSQPATSLEVASTTASSQASTTAQVVDKTSLTINILNASTNSGVASALASALESAGYAKASTGNQVKQISTTTLTINDSKGSFGPGILEEVKKLYPNTKATNATNTAPFDVIIVIGGK
jgi:hypothetical protein